MVAEPVRAVLVAAAVCLAAGATQPAEPLRDVPMAPALQAALDDWARAPGHHGVSASLVLPDGAQWAGVAGHAAEGEPLAPDHLIQIASITKTMTAAVVLQLVDEGVLRLDDPINRWLSERPNVDGAVTIHQLLNHTAGLANYTSTQALAAAITGDPTHVFTADELLSFAGPPVSPPGTRTEYTNTAFVLLGLIAEHATGRALVDLYRQRLFVPLDLQEIFMPGLEEPPRLVASAVAPSGLIVAPLDRMSLLSIGWSAFGLLASARDVARWGHALFTGDVISDDMQARMRELVPAAGTIPGETGVGLGIRSYAYVDRVQLGHSGGASLGSSLLLHDVETGITVVVVMNQGAGAQHFVLAPRLLQIASS